MGSRTSGKARVQFGGNRTRAAKRKPHRKRSQLWLEKLEDRVLLAVGPQLLGISPNNGALFEPLGDNVRNVAPRELTFRFNDGQVIDESSLNGIRITRGGSDSDLETPGDNEVVAPGFIGLVGLGNEIVVRFASILPDDEYRIEVFGSGPTPLRNVDGDAFNDGEDVRLDFELDLGAQIIAVVPQPTTPGDVLQQDRDTIRVYFNQDDLDVHLAEDSSFYQLIYTNDTVENTDDGLPFEPETVSYDKDLDQVVLTFAADIEDLAGPGTYRLRIGTKEAKPEPPEAKTPDVDPGSSFASALDLGSLGPRGHIVSAAIDAQRYILDFPGDNGEPGHRDIPAQAHVSDASSSGIAPSPGDPVRGISTLAYNFKEAYGFDPNGNVLFNLITESQKDRAREVFELYGYYLGVQFLETERDGLTIVTGDLRAITPTVVTGPGGLLGLSAVVGATDPITFARVPTSIMDSAEVWDDSFGESDDPNRLSWFKTAMHEIGHLLGLDHTNELPPPTVMFDDVSLAFDNIPEGVFPGDHDIVHGRHLYRPESKDIDLYRFSVDTVGLFTAETLAERQADSSLLDSALSLYRENADGSHDLVTRNDDYFSEDAFVRLVLQPGTYFVGVTASGNNDYDPTIEDSGIGGTTQGPYDLRLNFRPEVTQSILDSTGTAFDGDADGIAGGVYNFWFRAQTLDNTIFVDKSADDGGDGLLASPLNNIVEAFDKAKPGDIVRIVGNQGADGDISQLEDNLPYEIGFDGLGQPLPDGTAMQIPRAVTVMVDAGAVFKLQRASIHVGSSTPEVDRSGAALQVLGTPVNSVIFTSNNEEQIGIDTSPLPQSPSAGDWGGIIFQNDVDRAEPGRLEYEQEGIFLNYVNHANMRFGGGAVVIDSVEQTVTPIQMIDARPTISFNTITLSADAAMSATPDSFAETNFHAPRFQSTPFTSDYARVGPDVHGNEIVGNTINGLFVRIETPAGNELQPLTVAGRWDDSDIVHVVTENLDIQGGPGGPVGEPNFAGSDLPLADQYDLQARLDASLVIDPGITVKLDGAGIRAGIGTQLVAEAVDGLEVIFTSVLDDRYGAGGTFDTSNNQAKDLATEGDWTGLYFGHAGRGSVDHAILAYGGGVTKIGGTFAGFNTIEVHQAELRITNSVFEFNANGMGGQAPPGRFGFIANAPGVVFVGAAQPIIVNNLFRGTAGPANQLAPAISIGVNALNYRLVPDYGRTTGPVNLVTQFRDNQGPLIRQNQLQDNKTNGMVVRGATLTTQSVWDDTDITHIVVDTIYVSDFHTFGGLRIESGSTESLVVKLSGDSAGFTALGTPLDIDDRIGGAIQIIGQPGHPVVLTSLADKTAGAGFQPNGRAQTDAANDGLPERTQPLDAFRIGFQIDPALAVDLQIVEQIERAGAFWESLIEDPITLIVDVTTANLNPPGQAGAATLGQTVSELVTLGYENVRELMIADGRPHESILAELPSFGDFLATLPENIRNPFSVSGSMVITRANALALGLDPLQLPAVVSAFAPDFDQDTVPDYNRDGVIELDQTLIQNIQANQVPVTDLFDIIVHEMGHLLGFTSAVSAVDAALDDVTLLRVISLNTLDLFRLAPGAGSEDFTNSPRILDPELEQVFYDGGRFNPIGISILGIDDGDIPLSTGRSNGDGFQPGHWKDGSLMGGITLGVMDPAGETGASGLAMSNQDKWAFDLIGWDVAGAGAPGDWRSIRLEQYSHDRNVEVVLEREDPEATAPGTNKDPNTAQFIGALAPNEKGGDDNRRLGFEIHGFISEPNDRDVYSFDADAGTEVWFDIDRTTHSLDAVVELVDASPTNPRVIARSDNSTAEEFGAKLIDPSDAELPFGEAMVISKSAFIQKDRWTTNPRDPAMRVILPGAPGTTNTYHVRVRSSNPDVGSDIDGGLTSGVYQLQIRLRELDEIAGSTVRFADVRYATNGIEVIGQPIHSPLLGEVTELVALDERREDVLPNDTIANAQFIGNLLETDRATLSIAGELVDLDPTSLIVQPDVDWYQLDVNWTSISDLFNLADVIFDLDYADGLARPDAALYVYDASGTLVVVSEDSDILDDQPQRGTGSGSITDLSRGSGGPGDPLIGPVDLPTGTYFVAVTTKDIPTDLLQFLVADPPNPFVRLEPVDSISRIAEDHIEFNGGSTFDPPQTPRLLSAPLEGPNINVSDAPTQTYSLFAPSGAEITEGETITIVSNTGRSTTYEFDNDGIVSGSHVPIPYDLSLTPALVALLMADTIGASAAGNEVGIGSVGSVGQSPDSSVYISRPSVVPFKLGDVTLYVSQNNGLGPVAQAGNLTSIVTIDPFTGTLETVVISIAENIGDIDLRVEIPNEPDPNNPTPIDTTAPLELPAPIGKGDLFSFSLGGLFPTDETTGTFFRIETGISDRCATTGQQGPNQGPQFPGQGPGQGPLIPGQGPLLPGQGPQLPGCQIVPFEDDGIETYDPNPLWVPPDPPPDPPEFPDPVRSGPGMDPMGVGCQTHAFTFLDSSFALSLTHGLLICSRLHVPNPELPFTHVAGLDNTEPGTENVLYIFNRNTGVVDSSIEMDRNIGSELFDMDFQMMDASMIFPTPATSKRERGVVDTSETGGTVTGMTVYDGIVYVVDNKGGFYKVEPGQINPASMLGVKTTLIATITDDRGRGVSFAGLTMGPKNVEAARYQEVLFAIDDSMENAKLYSFDLEGVLQPVFADGQTSIATGAVSPTGLAFSTLDRNLWHRTEQRQFDAGHGMEVPVTNTRNRSLDGGQSFYFGVTSTEVGHQNFDFPGGAHGSLTTNTFSLEDYEASDRPVFYFNYLLATEGTDFDPMPLPLGTPMRDSFRVYISDDSQLDRRGQWYLLATNNSYRDPLLDDEYDDQNPFDDVVVDVQELFDNTDTWRQARIDLSTFAGSDKLRLRFDFSSAGAMDVGTAASPWNPGVAPWLPPDFDDQQTMGSELRLVDAFEIHDGQSITIGRDTFEFDLGYTLLVPSGQDIPDGETLTVTSASGQPVTIEFDRDDDVDASHVGLAVTDTMTAANVALSIAQAIGGSIDVVPLRHANRVNLPGVETISQFPVDDPSVFVDGAPDVTPDTVRVPIELTMNSIEVAEALVGALAEGLGGDPNTRGAFKRQDDVIYVVNNAITDRGQLGVASDLRGDEFGAFYASGPPGFASQPPGFEGPLRGLDNVREGVYIDDLIIGFAERGELVTGNEGIPAPDFTQVPSSQPTIDTAIRTGTYQLEIRRGPEYSASVLPFDPFLTTRQLEQMQTRTFDTNDRLTQSSTMTAPAGADISPGQTFVLGGGSVDITFQYVDRTVDEGNDTIATATDSGLVAGERGTYLGIGSIGDNTAPIGDNNNPLQGLDVDIISVELNAGDVMAIDVDAFNGDTRDAITSQLDSILTIFNEDGQLQAQIDNNPAPGDPLQIPFLDPYIRYTAPTAGTYYVAVSGNGNVSFDPTVAGSGELCTLGTPCPRPGSYEITIDVNGGDPSSGDKVEIGFATFDTAPLIAQRVNRTINSDEVQDRALNVTAGLIGTGNRVELFGPDVRIDRVKNALAPEPNDRLADAVDTGILFGQDVTYRAVGDIAEARDVDLFRMDLHAGEIISAGVSTVALGSTLIPAVELRDASGRVLVDPTVALPPLLIPVTGTYYVGVSSGGAGDAATGEYELEITVGRGQVGLHQETIGDSNLFRDQGQILIHSNVIRDSLEFGILIDAGLRDVADDPNQDPSSFLPRAAPVRNLLEFNSSHLTRGVTIANNILARGGQGGIRFSGDPFVREDPSDPQFIPIPLAPIAFGRIINNTIFGQGGETFSRIRPDLEDRLTQPVELEPRFDDVGILVTDNASPTLLNNIVVNFDTGILVDDSSNTTVIGGTVYQGNETDASTALGVGLGNFPILLKAADPDDELDESDPLFVDPRNNNFYLDANSRAIDSSVDSLEDRPGLVTITSALGVSVSPILVPDRDVTGQLRVDDPDVDTPAGVGENVFKDRGALDRADFFGPTARLISPRDNDAAGTDKDPRDHFVQTFETLFDFSIELVDGADPSRNSVDGTGADDRTVTSDKVTITQDSKTLQEGIDYTFDYDRTNNLIRLTPLTGIWVPDRSYVISIDNGEETGIRDLANNPLNPNQLSGATQFTIEPGRGVDYGDAPDPSYPTFAESDGASHFLRPGFQLGDPPDAETDGQSTPDASGDTFDDGIQFKRALSPNIAAMINVKADPEGRLDAWIDFNRDGDWNDVGEQIFVSKLIDPPKEGIDLRIVVPSTAAIGTTFARFRWSRDGGLSPTGRAEEGEVEDYQVTIYSNPWHNTTDRLDVSGDGQLSPRDALLIIRELDVPNYRDRTTGELPIPFESAPYFLDVNGDGFVAPHDALLVINRLENLNSTFAALSPRALDGGDSNPMGSETDDVLPPFPVVEMVGTSLIVGPTRQYDTSSLIPAVEGDDLLDRPAPLVGILPKRPSFLSDGPRPDWNLARLFAAVDDDTLTDMAEEVDQVGQSDDPRHEVFARQLWQVV